MGILIPEMSSSDNPRQVTIEFRDTARVGLPKEGLSGQPSSISKLCPKRAGPRIKVSIARRCVTAMATHYCRTSEQARLQGQNLVEENSVSSVKDAMIDIIGRQPEDSTYDEILRELAYARMVQRGLDDGDAGRTVSDSNVRRKIESWQK